MSQNKFQRVIGYDQDYPGSYRWPNYEILCPVCKKWKKDYGEVDEQQDDGSWRPVCIPCGNRVTSNS